MERLLAAARPNTPLRWLQLRFFIPQNWQRSSTISNIFQALHVFADCWLLFWKDLISADLTGNRPAKLISHKFSRSAAVPELIRRRQHTRTHSLMSTYRNTARMPKNNDYDNSFIFRSTLALRDNKEASTICTSKHRNPTSNLFPGKAGRMLSISLCKQG